MGSITGDATHKNAFADSNSFDRNLCRVETSLLTFRFNFAVICRIKPRNEINQHVQYVVKYTMKFPGI